METDPKIMEMVEAMLEAERAEAEGVLRYVQIILNVRMAGYTAEEFIAYSQDALHRRERPPEDLEILTIRLDALDRLREVMEMVAADTDSEIRHAGLTFADVLVYRRAQRDRDALEAKGAAGHG